MTTDGHVSGLQRLADKEEHGGYGSVERTVSRFVLGSHADL